MALPEGKSIENGLIMISVVTAVENGVISAKNTLFLLCWAKEIKRLSGKVDRFLCRFCCPKLSDYYCYSFQTAAYQVKQTLRDSVVTACNFVCETYQQRETLGDCDLKTLQSIDKLIRQFLSKYPQASSVAYQDATQATLDFKACRDALVIKEAVLKNALTDLADQFHCFELDLYFYEPIKCLCNCDPDKDCDFLDEYLFGGLKVNWQQKNE